ncbi:MAG TPA: hypothetical protein PLH83_08930 [Ruminococcus sp.]|nr:hypothetical protein [Ruminococcus sp.]
MNRSLKVVFNILIAAAALGILLMLFMIKDEIVNNAKKEEKNVMRSFEYEVKHRAYGEVTDTYFVYGTKFLEVPEGFEETKLTAEYAHLSFMLGVYEEKGDDKKAKECRDRLEEIKSQMDQYRFTADEIDKIMAAYSSSGED